MHCRQERYMNAIFIVILKKYAKKSLGFGYNKHIYRVAAINQEF
jgi:hypothetical protein